MALSTKERRDLTDSLERAREEHVDLLAMVEKARLLFEKRSRKLAQLETHIADLEKRLAEPVEERVAGADGDGHLPDTLRHALLIINPNSGVMANGGELLDDILIRLRAHGIHAKVGMKKSAKGTRKLAREAARNEDLVLVAGGDGTIEDVVSQMVGGTATLGIIPVGTMNNVARALGIPLVVEDACALIGMGVTRQIDIGRVVANAEPEREYFLETAGVGLSAIAIPAGDAAKSGRWDALPDALRKLFNIRPQLMRIELDDGRVIEANSQVVTVSNGPLIGNNILVAPDAKMDDGLLDIAVYDGMNKAELLAHFVAAANGNRVENPKVKFYRARRVKINAQEPIAVHSDKDIIETQQSLEIEVLPSKVPMVVGKGIGLTIPVEAVPSAPPLSGPQLVAAE